LSSRIPSTPIALLAEDEHVQRVTVVAERPRQETVVRRVVHRRVQDAIEPQQAGRLVQLVLHLRALRDLDHGVEVALDVLAELDVVPRVHGLHYTEALVLGSSRQPPSGRGR
jgi:hypothetical protein